MAREVIGGRKIDGSENLTRWQARKQAGELIGRVADPEVKRALTFLAGQLTQGRKS